MTHWWKIINHPFPKKGVYPFSKTGGGDYLCLDYRKNENEPKVVYYTHDVFYAMYINDRKNSLWILNDENGRVHREDNYNNGVREGEAKEYYQNGKLKAK